MHNITPSKLSRRLGRGVSPGTLAGALFFAYAALSLFAATASAQPAIPPDAMPPNDDVHAQFARSRQQALQVTEQDKAGKAHARLQVVRRDVPDPNAPVIPVPDATVELYWSSPAGGPSLLHWTATTGADGWADFGEVDVLGDPRKFQLKGRYQVGSVQQETAQLFARAGKVEGTLTVARVTGDPGAVIGATNVMILSIPQEMNRQPSGYKHVEIQQVFELTTGAVEIYDTSQAMDPDTMRGVKIDLPLDASGGFAQVVGGGARGNAEVADSMLWFRGVVYPAAAGYPSTRVMVRYFLKADGDVLNFAQLANRSWADVRVTFLRETDLPDYPVLDVQFADHEFSEESDAADQGVLEGRLVKVMRGYSLSPGDTLRFKVAGLPYPNNHIPYYLAAVAALLIFGGVFLGFSEVRKAKERADKFAQRHPDAVAVLDTQIEALYDGLTELERDKRSGIVDDDDYNAERERLRTRIALLMQKRDTGKRPHAS